MDQSRSPVAVPGARRRSAHPFLTLIAAAQMKAYHKSFLRALLKYANWDSGDNIFPSVPTLARDMNLGVRTIQKYLRRLEEMGVIHFIERSTGGAGNTHHLAINEEQLRALSRSCPPNQNPATFAALPRNSCTITPQILQNNPAESAGELLREQFKSNPPTPSTSRRVPPLTHSKPDVGGGGGGGGDGDDREMKQEPKAERSEAAPPTNTEHAARNEETYELLRDYEVSPANAQQLALRHTPAEVRAGIAWLRANSDGIRSKAGTLVKMLRDGECQALVKEKQQKRERQLKATILERRTKSAHELFNRALAALPEDRADLQAKKTAICAKWPDAADLAALPCISDEELLAPDADAVGLVNRLYVMAMQLPCVKEKQRLDPWLK